MLVLSTADVERLLPMRECIDVMADALRLLAEGGALLPLRFVMRLPDSPAAFATMPAYARALGAAGTPSIGVKVISVFPQNDTAHYDSHQGAVILFEAEHGQLLAIMDAASVTAIRTAAVSGVATRLLARDDASELALLGAGVQAATHLDAMCQVRPIRAVRVWGRTPERVRELAERASHAHGIPVRACATAREAVDGAHIVCAVTASRDPVLAGEWLAPGTHVNAIGASLPTARELDTAAVARSRFFVDRRESTLNEAGDFLIPKREGAVDDGHIVAELGELLTGAPGRRSPEEITLFKGLGLAIEDLAAARFIYERAVATGAGTSVAFGHHREA
jgi:ornithine cyclodeaminase